MFVVVPDWFCNCTLPPWFAKPRGWNVTHQLDPLPEIPEQFGVPGTLTILTCDGQFSLPVTGRGTATHPPPEGWFHSLMPYGLLRINSTA
jgi:hypothetical protein